MVSSDESGPEAGTGQVSNAKASRSKSSGKTVEQRQRKPGQSKQAQSKQPEAKHVQKPEPTPDAFLAAAETMPSASEPMELPPAAPDTHEAAAVVVEEPAAPAPVSARTITNAYGDYTRKSIEQTSSFFAELAGARSPKKAFELQTEFARTAFETFVDESRKIREMHRELAKQRLHRLESLVMGKRATR